MASFPSTMRALFFLVLLGTAAPATTVSGNNRRLPAHEYGTIVLDNFSSANAMNPVIFRHWVHRSKHTCRLCHVDIGFAMEANQTEVSAADIRNGDYCAVCHNGHETFACETADQSVKNCERCHSPYPIGKDRRIRVAFEKMADQLPSGRFGNNIDWSRASRAGKLNPKDSLPGVSFPRSRLRHDEGSVNLDAKLAGLPDILFSHQEHATWNSCDLCHPDIFALRAGATRYTMQDIFAGQYCGACHGRVAFPLKECARCHSRPVDERSTHEKRTD